MENIISNITISHIGGILYKPEPSELELINKAKYDRAAFGELFEIYYDQIYRYILHRTADIDIAQDLTSETFEIVLDKLWTFKWKNIPFSAWLYRVASNVINGYYRKNKSHLQSDIDEFKDTISDVYNDADKNLNEYENELKQSEQFLMLHSYIRKLKPKYQEVIALRYFENKQIREISSIVGKSEGTVKSLIHRALKYLENLIDPRILRENENE